MRWQKQVFAAAVLAMAVAVAGCGSAPAGKDAGSQAGTTSGQPTGGSGGGATQAQEPIRFGFFADMTGGASSLGTAEVQTAKLMQQILDEKGGIGGRKVEIRIIDSKSQEQEAVLAAKKLIDEGVVAIVGGTTTGASMAVINTVEQEEVPFVSMAAGAGIVEPVKKWVFKTPQTDSLALAKIFEYLKARGLSRVAWISSNNAYGDSGRAQFEKMAPAAGLEVVASERFNLDDKDMTAQLTRIKAANPQAVINWSIPPTASIVTTNFHQLGFGDTVLIQSHGVANAAYLEQSGDAANGVILPAGHMLVVDQMPDDNPRKQVIQDYMSEYAKRIGGSTNSFGGYAYDALAVVLKAVEAVGPDRAKVRDYLENQIKDFPGVTGTFSMSPTDHMGLVHGDSFELIEIRDGKWTIWKR